MASIKFDKDLIWRFVPDSGVPYFYAESPPTDGDLPGKNGWFVGFDENQVERTRIRHDVIINPENAAAQMLLAVTQGVIDLQRNQAQLWESQYSILREEREQMRDERFTWVESLMEENRLLREQISGNKGFGGLDIPQLKEAFGQITGLVASSKASGGDIDRQRLAEILSRLGEEELANQVITVEAEDLAISISGFEWKAWTDKLGTLKPEDIIFLKSCWEWALARVKAEAEISEKESE